MTQSRKVGQQVVDENLRLPSIGAQATIKTHTSGWVNVASYSDLVSGGDWTAALEAAIVAANGTRPVYVPGGSYFARDVDVSIAGTTIIGAGRDVVTIRLSVLASLDGSAIFDVAAANVTIRNLTLDGNKSAQPADGFHDSYNTGPSGKGRAFRALVRSDSGGDGLTVEDCGLINAYGAPVATYDANYVKVRNNDASSNNFETACIYGSADYGGTTFLTGHVIEGNYVKDTGSGDSTVNGNAVIVRKSKDVRVVNNIFVNQERNAIKMEHCRDYVLQGNVARQTQTIGVGGTFGDYAAYALWGAVLNATVIGNEAYDCKQGLNIPQHPGSLGVINVTISNNVFDTMTGATQGDGIGIGAGFTIDGLTITGNTIRSPARHGIYIRNGTTSRVTIAGNTVTGAGSTGAYLLADGGNFDTVTIAGNSLQTTGGNGAVRLEHLAAETMANVTVAGNTLIGTSSFNEVSAGIVTSGAYGLNHTSGTVTLQGTWTGTTVAGALTTTGDITTSTGTISGNFVRATNAFLPTTSGGSVAMEGRVSNGASAVAVKLGNLSADLITAGAKALAVYRDNLTTEVAAVRRNASTWGVRLQSPDGTWYLLTIANGGTVSIAADP